MSDTSSLRRSMSSRWDMTSLCSRVFKPSRNGERKLRGRGRRQKLSVRQFGSPSGEFLGIITSSLFFPSVLLTAPAGWISDRYGRKYALGAGSVMIVAGSIMGALCNDVNTFIGGNYWSKPNRATKLTRSASPYREWLCILQNRRPSFVARTRSSSTSAIPRTELLLLLPIWRSCGGMARS